MLKIINVVGARPNFMKVAPLHRAFVNSEKIESIICHTGQHYDAKMSSIFFEQLELPKPHIYLGIQGGSHAEQTGQIMIEFEKILLEQKPDIVLVVGDVNSTLACSITAKKLHIPVVHVEAGLRSGDMRMPEEVNRIVTDSISDDLFVTEQSGIDNLKNEGVADEKVHFVGHVMIDSLVHYIEKSESDSILDDLGLEPGKYILSTLHRPSNVDTQESLENLIDILEGLVENQKVVLPLHPRTESNLKKFGLNEKFKSLQNLISIEPQGYLPFIRLIKNAKALVTDSGGIQEETTFLKVPCITLRENTERPITIDIGTNQLVKIDRKSVLEALKHQEKRESSIPPLWDGKAAERIAKILLNKYSR
jgi:UDP-N-acetylglucosamine 2-epimerase (non-hydrolysing)